MSGFSDDLSDEQANALAIMRENLSDVSSNPLLDDDYLLRFLRAREFDVTKAETMLRQCLKWRDEIDIENRKNREIPEFTKFTPNCSPPIGKAKDGTPVMYSNCDGADVKGTLQCCQVKDLIWLTCYGTEKADFAVRAISKPYKGGTFILDYRNLSMDTLSKPNLDLQVQFNKSDGILANYFPESVNKVILLSNSTVLNVLFKLYKAIAPKNTLAKIELVKDPKDLKKFVDEDQLIGYYGGTLVDEDGDPKFSSKINYPSKVPKSYYLAPKFADYELNSEYSKVEISRGQEISIAVDVDTVGFSIIWFVLSKDGELDIGINFKAGSDEVETVEPMAEVHCHVCPESGSKICSKIGTYTLVIRNNAVLKNKRVAYNVDVVKEDGKDVI